RGVIDLLVKIFAVPQLRFQHGFGFSGQLAVKAHVLAQVLAHGAKGVQRADVKAGVHAIGAPKLNVVGIVVRLLDGTAMARVPGFYAVIQAYLYHGIYLLQPFIIPADAPVAVDLHNAAQLTVGGRVEIMTIRLYRHGRPKILVTVLRLVFAELGAAQAALQRREQVRHGLRVVQHVRAAAGVAAPGIAGAFPTPKATVVLPQLRRRFQDAQVAGHRLHHLGRQRAAVKGPRKPHRFLPQLIVMLAPVIRHCGNTFKFAAVPGLIGFAVKILIILIQADIAGAVADALLRVGYLFGAGVALADLAVGRVPAKLHADSFFFTRR